jgi:hypothetical protein
MCAKQCDTLCEECKRKKGDELLEKCASLFANLGTDSTEEEIKRAYKEERCMLEQLSEFDPEKGARLLI